uniref:Uncharacterized protein n=1 Tax=Anguilla anguilla TaxID=7936 RepID=A0A0E9S139_ANGAN
MAIKSVFLLIEASLFFILYLAHYTYWFSCQ